MVPAAASPPAGGAALGQVIGVSIAATLLTVALLWLGFGHRSGRVPFLGWAARLASRLSGLPGWAALPSGLAAGSLLAAVFGLYWDISLHIDNGRDPGPLANPSHYFILLGLFGIFSAGWLAIVLPEGRPSAAAVRLAPGWYAPVSGILMMACASFALLGFPLDDVWHRLFGQDVTLWGPTHLMMLSGAALTLIAILGLLAEGGRRPGEVRHAWVGGRLMRAARVTAACGGLLVGLSIYQGEFDYGVPQFRLLFEPMLLAVAAGVALPAARLLAGRGAALAAALFFIGLRGSLTLIVTGVFGESVAHFPLYLAEALLVEAVAWRTRPQDGPWRVALGAGALIGTVGVLAEYAWSHVWMPVAWPAHDLLPAIAVALPAALAGGVLAAFLTQALRRRPSAGAPRARLAPAAALVVLGVLVAILLPTHAPAGARTIVALTPAGPGEVHATVRVVPASVTRDADWVRSIAWQGKAKLRGEQLREVAPGVFRTTEPLPVGGTWKTAIRVQNGRTLAGTPIFLPADPAIPVGGVPARPRIDRALTPDHEVLQRERKQDVPGWLWTVASLAVLAICVTLLTLLGWGLRRLARPEPEAGGPAVTPAARPPGRARTAGRIAARLGRAVAAR